MILTNEYRTSHSVHQKRRETADLKRCTDKIQL